MSVEVNIEFERECYVCYGRSAWVETEPCNACGSKGRVPTELGEKLLEFLKTSGFQRTTTHPTVEPKDKK